MNIDLRRLINNLDEEIKLNDFVEFDQSYLENCEIKKLENVYVNGSINKNLDDIYTLSLNVTGTMVIPCSLSLEDTNYKFNININEILTDTEEKDEEYIKIINNSIDIIPIIWQNIVMEIPIKVVNPEIDVNEYKSRYNIKEEE